MNITRLMSLAVLILFGSLLSFHTVLAVALLSPQKVKVSYAQKAQQMVPVSKLK